MRNQGWLSTSMFLMSLGGKGSLSGKNGVGPDCRDLRKLTTQSEREKPRSAVHHLFEFLKELFFVLELTIDRGETDESDFIDIAKFLD